MYKYKNNYEDINKRINDYFGISFEELIEKHLSTSYVRKKKLDRHFISILVSEISEKIEEDLLSTEAINLNEDEYTIFIKAISVFIKVRLFDKFEIKRETITQSTDEERDFEIAKYIR